MSEADWALNPHKGFVLEGVTLTDCMREVRNLLDGHYTTYVSAGAFKPGEQRVDSDKIRDIGQRLQALLEKAEGPIK